MDGRFDGEQLAHEIIGAAIEVHKAFGPGLLEQSYEAALAYELELRGVPFERQKNIPLKYKGKSVAESRLDFLVGNQVVVELKAVDNILPIHQAQVISYLKISGLKLGLLINFNVPVLRQGIKRVII